MLLRCLSKPNDPHEWVIHQNLRTLVETTAIQQAECSVSRRQLVTSLPVLRAGTQQMGHYTLSPQQLLSATHEAAAAPHPDLTTAPRQPPIYAQLGPNRGTCNGDRSLSTDGPGPPTFAHIPQQASFLPCSNGGHGKGKAKCQDQDEGPSTRREKRIERIAADRPTPRWSPRPITWARSPSRTDRDTFHELIERSCTNHNYPVNHLYKDYQLLKRLLR